jgi:hypothetical protein
MHDVVIEGIEPASLAAVLASGVDHGGNAITPVVDAEGGWQLRCCLADSRVGDRIAVVAWSPFAWDGPFREVGPIVVHAEGCPATWQQPAVPEQFDARPLVLRPYSDDHRIAYDLVRRVDPGEGVADAVAALLREPGVAEVHARNPLAGCFAFAARRTG